MSGMEEFVYMKHNRYQDFMDGEFEESSVASGGRPSRHKFGYMSSGRDIQLPLKIHQTQTFHDVSPDEEISVRKYIGNSIGVVSLLTESLLCHPFVVLRRQCQVHHNSAKYHLVPITLVPVIFHIQQRQGVSTLWKGIGSSFLIRGMSLGIEDFLSKVTPWPKELKPTTTKKQFAQHLLLKCLSIGAVMPFYCASLVETVQSDIASEKPGFLDVFREGGLRLLYWSAPQKGRMLPVWALIGPSISLGISKYVVGLLVKGLSYRLLAYRQRKMDQKRGARAKEWLFLTSDSIEVYSTLASMFASEAIFYPFETILHRLQLQGTRTIIDNLDSGYSVVPIMTSYESVLDCYKSTIASEGVSGLYKGFGAVVLQFAAHYAVLKLAQWVIRQVVDIYSNKPPPKVAETYNLDVRQPPSAASTTLSRSLSSLNGQESFS